MEDGLKTRFLPRTAGHKAGVETIRKVLKECQRLNVKYLTLYAFSTENWKRPKAGSRYINESTIYIFKK